MRECRSVQRFQTSSSTRAFARSWRQRVIRSRDVIHVFKSKCPQFLRCESCSLTRIAIHENAIAIQIAHRCFGDSVHGDVYCTWVMSHVELDGCPHVHDRAHAFRGDQFFGATRAHQSRAEHAIKVHEYGHEDECPYPKHFVHLY